MLVFYFRAEYSVHQGWWFCISELIILFTRLVVLYFRAEVCVYYCRAHGWVYGAGYWIYQSWLLRILELVNAYTRVFGCVYPRFYTFIPELLFVQTKACGSIYQHNSSIHQLDIQKWLCFVYKTSWLWTSELMIVSTRADGCAYLNSRGGVGAYYSGRLITRAFIFVVVWTPELAVLITRAMVEVVHTVLIWWLFVSTWHSDLQYIMSYQSKCLDTRTDSCDSRTCEYFYQSWWLCNVYVRADGFLYPELVAVYTWAGGYVYKSWWLYKYTQACGFVC